MSSPHITAETSPQARTQGWRYWIRHPERWPAAALIAAVRLYQWTLSPIFGRQCRFHPTCSEYFIQSVRKRGAVVGTARGLWRIARCNPWCRSGYDPP